jgi:hypothetical protein
VRIEGKDLHAGLGTLSLAVVVEEGQLLRGGRGQLLPQLLHGRVMEAASPGRKDDPRQCSVPEALIEAFEALEFVDHRDGDAATTASRDDRERIGQEPEHALRCKAAFEGAHGVRMGVGFLGPLCGGAVLKEHERADEFRAIWQRVVERELGCVGIGTGQHW